MATAPVRIGVALGSGGARGLAHIPYIEAMDELGLTPSRIAGTSIGALIGVGWANGMSGKALREHAYQMLGTFQVIASRLWTTNRPTLRGLMDTGLSIQIDARNIVEAFLPEGFPGDFAKLKIPFEAVATDYSAWEQRVFSTGELWPAIAASLAIPSLFRPLRFENRLFIDGGVSNPLPLDRAREGSDIVIGIDVNGAPEAGDTAEPSAIDVGFVATQIMTRSLIQQTLALYPADIYVHPQVRGFRVLEFWRVREILAQVDLEKEAFKRDLAARVERILKAGGSALLAPSRPDE